MNDENLKISDPVFSKEAVEQYIDNKTKSRRVATYVLGSKKKFDDSAVRSPCINCEENHQLDGCLKFMGITLKDIINFLSKKKYCFGCSQPMKPKHNAKTCDKRLNCRTCSGGHPTAMHGYVPKRKGDAQDDQRSNENDESVTNLLSTVEKHQTKVVSMCVVPGKVRAAAQGKDVLTYAMLSKCSQGSFIQEALVKKMQTSGRRTTLNLKALNGERSESTTAIEGLQVAGSKDGSTWIKLPRIYTRKHLPLDKKEVATPDKIEEWDYLKTISSEITQTDDVEVGLLIGANCMKAFEPTKVIASNNGGPYAYQTRLGWCIVGPISNMVGKDSIGCHHIAVQDAISSKIADHQFVVEESMKDISLEEMFQEMHQNDFVEKEVINVNGLLENMVESLRMTRHF